MDKKWTPSQNDAINSVGGTVLVSAAAGSGKTAVLVQRIINQITDSENPIDITKFLIVTFTKPSAKEMKNRISKKLSEMIIADPKNENLQRQKSLLKYAQIGTIDSFCKTFAEENFYKLGISPKINIATKNEIEILKSQAVSDALEYFYGLNDENFEKTFDILNGEKNDDDMEKIIKIIREFLSSLPFPEKWMEEKSELYKNISENTNILDLPWVKTILEYTKDQIDMLQNMTSEALSISKSKEKVDKAYTAALSDDLINFKKISEYLTDSKSWDTIAKSINSLKFMNLKPLKGEEFAYEKNLVSTRRNYVKDVFKELKNYFIFSEKEIIKDLESLYPVINCLFEITKRFEKNLHDLKTEKNIAEFIDLERWTLALLSEKNEDGKIIKSSLAREVSERYKEIMIDEYQDINDIQDTIFRMVSKNEKNIFAVGDVKQSIYKFRNSKPEIFLSKKDQYETYDKNLDSYPAKIILGKNFRSRSEIIDVINFIFGSLMSKKAGDIEYNDEEALFSGAEFKDDKDISAELAIIGSSSEISEEVAEANFIAEKIMKMISEKYQVIENGTSRDVMPGDFCILLRKLKNSANIYKNELNKYGIHVKTESDEKFLETSEILTIISLLKIINNPIQDIPLISSMLSPIFNFTPDELSEIRTLETTLPFYFSLKKYIEFGQNEALRNKANSFYKTLEKYRNLSVGMFCNELIDLIYSETDYPSICMALENGEIRKSNLMLFSEYAKNFENQHHKGLFGFLSFIENIKKRNGDLTSATSPQDMYKSVKIMTIHKSKGLEFPICILAGCGKSGGQDDTAIYINTSTGIGIKLINEDGTVKLPNIVTNAITLQNKIESTSEELRILYVALTRAKQKLIMVAGTKNSEKLIQKHFTIIGSNKKISPQYIMRENKIIDWLLMCAAKSNLRNKLCSMANLPELISEEEYPDSLNWGVEYIANNEDITDQDTEIKILQQQANDKVYEETESKNDIQAHQTFEMIKKRFDFKYSENDLTNLPLKVSASQLTQNKEWQNYIASSKPSFMSSSSMTPTDRGNSMHKLMCYIDFQNVYKYGLDHELNRLKTSGFLDENEFMAIDKNSIKNFVFGDMGKRLYMSPKIYREHRFSVTIPSRYLTEYNCLDNHYTVMQGAIDCAFLENEKYVIIDYKTDKASSTEELWTKYSKQLKLYKFALEQSKNIKVSELILYSFSLGKSYNSKCE